MNSGGRQRFEKDSRVRVLEMAGTISDDVWLITPPPLVDTESKNPKFIRADRKGQICLRQEKGSKELKVHFRRVLPVDVDGKAPVIESGDKYRAICPKCGCVENVNPSQATIKCPQCGNETQVHWIGVKPMTTADTATQDPKSEEKTPETAAAAKTPATAKPVREAVKVDFDDIKKLDNCELWTKKHVKFDHPGVDVEAHAVLYVDGENSRKYCFNTYDSTLGKKQTRLPLEEFVSDGKVTEGKREKPWFAVKNIDKARTKLEKDGYEKR